MTTEDDILPSGAGLPPGLADDQDSAFVVEFAGFEGPLDLLLDLARADKVDLRNISVDRLADQFIAYLQKAKELKLEIAGEYLVMAAWLAYLKSKLLLPEPEEDGEDAATLAAQLAERLRLLAAVRQAVEQLQQRPTLGTERFAAGAAEGLSTKIKANYRSDLAKLLRAYIAATAPKKGTRLSVKPRQLMSVQDALQALSTQLTGRNWTDLMSFLPPGLLDDVARNGAIAAHLVAGLELARQGAAEINQAEPFGQIQLRRRNAQNPGGKLTAAGPGTAGSSAASADRTADHGGRQDDQ